MGQRFSELSDQHCAFINDQKLFFVGTATADSRVNISPKGMDALRILGPTRVLWLNVTGSGNETAVHIAHEPRMTLMFCDFNSTPLILRLYGTATVIHRNDPQWPTLLAQLNPLPGARQIFDLHIDLVQTSCGMAVPKFEYAGERLLLNNWAVQKGDAGLKLYWAEKNQLSIDGIPTDIVAKNG